MHWRCTHDLLNSGPTVQDTDKSKSWASRMVANSLSTNLKLWRTTENPAATRTESIASDESIPCTGTYETRSKHLSGRSVQAYEAPEAEGEIVLIGVRARTSVVLPSRNNRAASNRTGAYTGKQHLCGNVQRRLQCVYTWSICRICLEGWYSSTHSGVPWKYL